MKTHVQLTRYNITNILALAILIPVQFLNLTLWLSWYLVFLDGDTVKVLLFWPLALMAGIIAINRKTMRTFIHKANEQMYQANNVNIDTVVDNGKVPKEALAALPTSGIPRIRRSIDLDTTFFGELHDVGIDYVIDDFQYSLSYRRGDDTHYAYNLNGNALIIQSDVADFGPDWSLFINSSVRIAQCVFVQPNHRKVKCGNQDGTLAYSNEISEQQLEVIERMIDGNSQLFGRNDDVIVLFKGNQFIYITTKNNKFKIKLPFFIHKLKYDSIVSGQKAQVYRFNQFLTDISRVMLEASEKKK